MTAVAAVFNAESPSVTLAESGASDEARLLIPGISNASCCDSAAITVTRPVSDAPVDGAPGVAGRAPASDPTPSTGHRWKY